MIEASDGDLSSLRDELARRRARRIQRRYRWRWLRRWRRRRLLLKLLAIERDLTENPHAPTAAVRRAEATRVAYELSRNARRLFH